MAFTENVGGGLPAIPASAILGKTGGGNKPLLTAISNNAVNATGAGITYTVTDKCLLMSAVLLNLTASDTVYTLTDRSTGKILAEYLTPTADTSLAVVASNLAVTAATTVTPEAGITSPIECQAGFELFVKTIADASIDVRFTYLRLA